MYENLAILAAFIFLYSIISGGLERTPVNGAIVFTAFGLVFGPLGLGYLTLDVNAEGLRTLAELTLALVLFTDASNANLGVLKQSVRIPRRLLLIGLPLTILLGFGAGVLLFGGLTLLEIAILATMLAPTDAALGKAVVTDESVPANMREGLNVESGLNDGICVPILFVFLALASGTAAEGGTSMLALKLVAQEIGIGAAVGIVFALLGAWAIKQCAERDWITDTWSQLPVIGLAVSCFATAQILGGSGFIACFAGGLLFGGIAKQHKPKLLFAAEGTGDTLALITWVAFGAVVVGHSIGSFSWEVVVYALLSLTVVRMLPVFLVLGKQGLSTADKLFMGWFGPRGLASIVFAVIVLGEKLPGGGTIAMTVVCTILFSVILHGLSANPLVAALVARTKGSSGKAVADDKA
jgi:NhaP-type Na+/H+ or K+/H+ antiporter